MWCVPKLTPEFLERMEDVLALYEKPYDPQEPLLCFDEKSKQLIEDTRPTQNTQPGKARRRDYEYRRNGTRNMFMTVEPKGGFRTVQVTQRRTKADFAREIERIVLLPRYAQARRIHFVLDNLNTHFEKSLIETCGEQKARRLMDHIQFHHTPKHASWLNMAEIELSIVGRQCLNKRISTETLLTREMSAWENYRNGAHATIQWKFTVKDARAKFKYTGSKLN
jgi:hypothetical protein